LKESYEVLGSPRFSKLGLRRWVFNTLVPVLCFSTCVEWKEKSF